MSHHAQNDPQSPLRVAFSDTSRQDTERVVDGFPARDVNHACNVVVLVLIPNELEGQFANIRRVN